MTANNRKFEDNDASGILTHHKGRQAASFKLPRIHLLIIATFIEARGR